ncbi:MAG: DUF4440 domain-containing protein, partial [Ferruginibacter sp.]
MKKLTFCCCFFLLASFSFAQSKDELAVRNLLNGQIADWNKGNIEAFMTSYWKSDSLLFIGNSGANYGWQTTLDHYKASYPDTTVMGKLRFEIVAVKRLSVMYFFVAGKWFLTRSIGNLQGAYTL